MIINELNIQSFGGIKNLKINLSEGINVVFGENEAGKSTIEGFIKVMLYGFPQRRSKEERIKYSPFNGGGIKGEMKVSKQGQDYIIKRTFGITKKEDTSLVLNGLTGQMAQEIDFEEPGKSLLGVNSKTFEKTLFISQLGVSFSKDQEDEIMEKLTSLFGCGEDEVSYEKGLNKLFTQKKELTTARGIGSLDIMKKNRNELLQEKYEAYNISSQNLQWEEELLKEKKKRSVLNKELISLELYKKYLKKVKLNKEFKDISEYLSKSKELQKEKEKLGALIDEEFVDDLKEENKIYLGLLDSRENSKEELSNLNEELYKYETESREYKFFNMLEGDWKEKVLTLKFQQQSLEEKLSSLRSLEKSIEKDKMELESLQGGFKAENLEGNGFDKIPDILNSYENNLLELKRTLQEKKNTKSDLFKILGITLFLLGGGALLLPKVFKIIGVILLVIGGSFLAIALMSSREEWKIKNLKSAIKDIEGELSSIGRSVGINDMEELIMYFNRYKATKEKRERLHLRIEEQKKLLEEGEYYEVLNKFNKNKEMILSLIRMSKSNTLDEVLEKLNIYNEVMDILKSLKDKVKAKEGILKELNRDINDKELILKNKLKIMDLQDVNLLDIEIYIKKYKEKLIKYKEIESNIKAIEGTYNALLKDRDIEAIKEELKGIINDNTNYSYETEEEIEGEEKNKSRELINTEKNIKDLENNIKNRFIGKRTIVTIEEELENLQEKILKNDKRLQAIEFAADEIQLAFEEIRREVGPQMNKKIGENFNILSHKKYKEVLLGDDYSMQVRDGENIFKGDYLSNGANDQLYLALRISLIEMMFSKEEYPLILDDAFVQYDNKRRREALRLIKEKIKGQIIIFTCHKLEEEILSLDKVSFNSIRL